MTETPARRPAANDHPDPADGAALVAPSVAPEVPPQGGSRPPREQVNQTGQEADAPLTTPHTSGGLFRKRPDAIGPAPVYFEIALGIAFGISVGLLLNHPIIGAVFGGLLGALYAVYRHSQGPPR